MIQSELTVNIVLLCRKMYLDSETFSRDEHRRSWGLGLQFLQFHGISPISLTLEPPFSPSATEEPLSSRGA